jgi:excisionase family DNA binding protein
MQNMQEMHTTQELLSADQVRSLLDVDRSTIYRMAGDGRLPAVKIGRQWRFPAASIRHLLSFADEGGPEPGHDPALDPTASGQVADLAAEALGVTIVITDLSGRPITNVANPCPRFLALEGDPEAVAACAEEWRMLAESPDPRPHFRPGHLGFLCARSFVWVDGRPLAMVLAGGVAPDGDASDDLFVISDEQRRRVVASLPKVAGLLASLAVNQRRSA